MPITTIDPTTALLVIDLQEGLAQVSTIHPLRSIASRAGELADAFREHGLPVVLVNVIGGGNTELLPELRRRTSDHVVTKSQVSAFHIGTGLAEHLTALGVTQVVIAGVSTSKGVAATARDAHTQGLRVTIAGDAVTDRSQHAHHTSLQRVFPRLGHVGSTAEIIAALPEQNPPQQRGDPMTLSDHDRAQIRRYLDGSNWMQLATTRGEQPRISHHWFAPDDDLNLYVITRHTRIHSQELALNPNVAGGIALPPFDGLGTLAFGATFQGTATQASDDEIDHAWTHYRQRFPFVDSRWNSRMITTGAIDSRIYKITPTVFRIFDETLNIPGNILEIRT